MEEDRKEYYGFEKQKDAGFPIYSANNAALLSKFLDNNQRLLILAIEAPQEIRQQRLQMRSPDLARKELSCRVEDPYYKSSIDQAHIVINNFGEYEKTLSKFDIATFVSSIRFLKSGWGRIKDLGNHTVIHHTRLFDIVEHDVQFSDDVIKRFQYARRSPGVRILVTNQDQMLITAEWRTEVSSWDFRLPGGKVFERAEDYQDFLSRKPQTSLVEKGQQAAAAELREECGLEIDSISLRHYHTSKCGATVEWDLLYYVVNFSGTQHAALNVSPEGERTILQWLSYETVLDLCRQGVIGEDRTAAVLMRYILNASK
ncbi:MAG: NUDIX hydrolase, partial [Holosporales bacterium]